MTPKKSVPSRDAAKKGEKKAKAQKAQKASVKVAAVEIAEAAKIGRPTDYLPEFDDIAERMCLLGAKDTELAALFGVSEVTLNAWKHAHPSFLKSLKAGKEQADANVTQSLYRRALGYEHEAVKILTVANGNNAGSSIEEVPYIERYPPDTTAGIFWLKNRRPDLWRDKVESEVTGAGGGPVEVVVRIAREGRRVTSS